jgi:hypothetical protein
MQAKNNSISVEMHSFYCIYSRLQKMGKSNGFCHFCKNNTETLQHLFFQCLKIKSIIEELNTIIIALCDQTYVLN